MQALTREAALGRYTDEPLPIAPLLASDALPEAEPVVLVERLAVINGRVYVLKEDEGGGLHDERCLGPLLSVSDWDVPEGLRNEFWLMVEAERDAVDFGKACNAEQLRRY